jgi:uncharacterized membrane protein (UPF0182 family)
MFILFFNTIQNCFNYRFHSDTIIKDPIKATRYCKIITIAIEVLYLAICKDLNVSIYSNLLLIFVIAFINALLQFYLEKIVINQNVLQNKETLIQLCKDNNVSDLAMQRLIDHYVNGKTFIEIASQECVEEMTIKQSIRRTKRKLGL